MTKRVRDIGSTIELDISKLLILNGSAGSDDLSSDHLLSGMENGTKVGMKQPPFGKVT